ncbi:MAG: hypothetical protein RIC19_04855 [Phaeodactylibacter sp.]|uniref:hypothetical protein n=1 Tax=Phaeodactylibacter sp. TaxID=1940289 RepID=UPI0032EA913D
MNTAQKLVEQIKAQQIAPRPQWHYTALNWAVWLGFGLVVLTGALAFSIILFTIQQVDFQLLQHMQHSWLEGLLSLMPLFWIGFLALALLLSMYTLRYSERGYKLTLAHLAGYSAAFSILLGTAFFISGGAQQLEQAFAIRVDLYQSVQEKKEQIWSMPEAGYLGGTIISVTPEAFQLEDFGGLIWTIDYANADWPPRIQLKPGEQIKLKGEQRGPTDFSASFIRPWGGQPMNGNAPQMRLKE